MSLNYRHAADVWIDAAQYLIDPPQGLPLPWWPDLTQMIGGLRPSELTLLCAPTGAGKTQFLANLSAQLLASHVPQFVAPVETGDSDFMVRVLSCLERCDFNSGDPVAGWKLEKLTGKYADLIRKNPFYISTHDNRVEIEEMINLLKYMHAEYGVRVALLDNLNFFLKVVSSAMEKAEMDSAMHEFVILAKKIPMHIILVVHPRKTDGGRVVSEFDIKGSSTAVQEASNVLLFNRPTVEDVESGKRLITDRELVFRKIRKRGQNIGRPTWLSYRDGRLEEFKSCK